MFLFQWLKQLFEKRTQPQAAWECETRGGDSPERRRLRLQAGRAWCQADAPEGFQLPNERN